MRKCVEQGPVTPIQKEWNENILKLVPERLHKAPSLKPVLDELFDEIKKDFNGSMKKSMGM